MGDLPLPPSLWPLFLRLAVGSETQSLDTPEARDRLIKVASEEGLLPLLLAAPDVPPAVARVRQTMGALGALMNARYLLQLEAARKLVAIAGDVMFIKGFDYRHRLYPSPVLRPSGDVDALVPPSSVAAAMRALPAAGYPRITKGLARMTGEYYELSYDVGQVRVELHRSIGHRIRASIDYEELWTRREPFQVGETTFFRPSPTDALLLHAVTLAKDEMAASLVRFVDFAAMLRLWPDRIEEAAALARRWNVQGALYASLRVTTTLFPEAATAAIRNAEESLLTRRARAFLDRNVIPDRTSRLSGHLDGRFQQLWRKFWLTDQAWRRVAFIGYSAWAMATAAAAGVDLRKSLWRRA